MAYPTFGTMFQNNSRPTAPGLAAPAPRPAPTPGYMNPGFRGQGPMGRPAIAYQGGLSSLFGPQGASPIQQPIGSAPPPPPPMTQPGMPTPAPAPLGGMATPDMIAQRQAAMAAPQQASLNQPMVGMAAQAAPLSGGAMMGTQTPYNGVQQQQLNSLAGSLLNRPTGGP
jgi:hypothetical protein